MSKCYWYHEGSCDQCCKDVPMCSNYKELGEGDELLELKAENNFNEQLEETLDKYRSRCNPCHPYKVV